ncbi:hypothetical protein [Sphingobacterium sp. BIGb0116]|uniref:hypothetical protein n=1 Tax=Sphingobacterium sp. BIGb0116 TaxID=2940619 RepID=UPI00216A2D7C|nr:hypothetical protein [Sphingobacterium sp. BIGb0116]MCS4164771.1 hypothetical protein [Sphingobacterium sp. BIGb0116]
MENIQIVFTSTLIAGLVSAIVTYFFNIRLKREDYKNEFYKKILDKRMIAYGYLEAQIAVMKTTILDDDNCAYHYIFSQGMDKFHEFSKNLHLAMSYSLWINDNTVKKMENLNDLFLKIDANSNDKNLISNAKENYQLVAKLRRELEQTLRDDMINLHKIEGFNKLKYTKSKRFTINN